MKAMLLIDQKTIGKTITLLNMQTNKLEQFIQAAAQAQTQDLQWISNLYQSRLKNLTEKSEKYNEGKNSAFNENTQTN